MITRDKLWFHLYAAHSMKRRGRNDAKRGHWQADAQVLAVLGHHTPFSPHTNPSDAVLAARLKDAGVNTAQDVDRANASGDDPTVFFILGIVVSLIEFASWALALKGVNLAPVFRVPLSATLVIAMGVAVNWSLPDDREDAVEPQPLIRLVSAVAALLLATLAAIIRVATVHGSGAEWLISSALAVALGLAVLGSAVASVIAFRRAEQALKDARSAAREAADADATHSAVADAFAELEARLAADRRHADLAHRLHAIYTVEFNRHFRGHHGGPLV